MTDLDRLRWLWVGRLTFAVNDWAGPTWLFSESMPTPAGVDFPLTSALAISKCARRMTDGDSHEEILEDLRLGTVSDEFMHSHAERVEGVAAALSRGTWPEGVPPGPREAELFFTEAWAAARSSQVASSVTRAELAQRWRVVDPRMLDYLRNLEASPFESFASLLDKIVEMDEHDTATAVLTNLRWQVEQDSHVVEAITRFAQLPDHLEEVAEDMVYVMRLEAKLKRLCGAALEHVPDRYQGFVDARQVVAEHRSALVTLMESFTAHEVDLLRSALNMSEPVTGPARTPEPNRAQPEEVQVKKPREGTAAPVGPAAPLRNRGLDPITVSVCLRRLWIDEFGPWLEATDNDLGSVWRDTLLRRFGCTLDVVSPINFGEGDPFIDIRDHITDLVSEATNGHVDRVRLTFLGHAKYKTPRRAKTTDLDIFDPGDPDRSTMEEFANGIGARVSRALQNDALAILSQLRVSAASRHRAWLVAPNPDTAEQVGSTPGAAHSLWDAVRRAQGVPKDPLYAIHSDGSLWAESPPILTR